MEQKHLKRLSRVWLNSEMYFITTCTANRRPVLACREAFDVFQDEFRTAADRHGWKIGPFVIMPDHVHFFCCPVSSPMRNLSGFVGALKQWTAKRICAALGIAAPLWQPEFFDHLLRTSESCQEKWDYMQQNPVRAGLVSSPDQWPWQGEIEKLTL